MFFFFRIPFFNEIYVSMCLKKNHELYLMGYNSFNLFF
ncbi:hypothetical protein FEM08_09600 [Flavobacterium gilvum]|nr:hypothetical protein FEM08_09600 [Flavobacterium gilvum]